MKNIILRNGILGGIAVSLVMAGMTMYMKNNPANDPSEIVGFASIILAFSFLFLGLKQQREAQDGKITFGKAFLTGLKIALLISTIYVLVWLIIYYNFFPNFMEQYSDMVLNKMKNTATPEEIASKTEEMKMMKDWYKNPVFIILLTYAEILPLGIIFSLIGGLSFKKK